MTADQLESSRPAALDARAAQRTLHERRRGVWRSALAVAAATVMMLVLLLLNRDKQAVEGCRRRMTNAVAALQKLHDAGGAPPLNLPLQAGQPSADVPGAARTDGHHYYDAFFLTRSGPAPEVGVCCCRESHRSLLGADGRFAIVYNTRRETYELRFVRDSEFARQAEELGLRIP